MKKRIIFNICSIVFLSLLVVFYGYRLFYYYMLEHKTYENKIVSLYEKLIDNKGIIGTDKGLVAKDNIYVYTTKSDDNYLYFAGRMWRIISIDENNNIKMITEDPQTLLTWNKDTEFNDSDINIWLNKNENENSGIFEASLKENIDRLMKQNNLIATLLTKEEYELLNKNNYLMNNTPFWIIGDDNLPAYVDIHGNIKNDFENSDFYGVRPVIILSSDWLYLSGSGIKDDPYILESNEKDVLGKAYVGEYVKYSGYDWKVIGVDSEKTKLVLNSSIENTNIFSKYDNVYSIKEGIGLYLNTEFYNSLENNDYILNSSYNINSYVINNEYSYLNTYNKSIEAFVGLYSLGDFFISEVGNTYTLTPYLSTKNTIYTINDNKKIYADFINSTYNVQPVISIDSNLFIIGGNGTKEKPYEIGR